MEKELFTKGKWKQRQTFEHALCTKFTDDIECYHNTIDIHDTNGRIICSVDYSTDTPNMGWGKNETTDKWKANAQLIASAPTLLEGHIVDVEFLERWIKIIRENGSIYDILQEMKDTLSVKNTLIEKATKID